MPRACNVCNAAEHRLSIDQRLRDGAACAEIAREFGFSEDSVQRHRARHVRRDSDTKGDLNAADILRRIVTQCDEIAENARTLGDARAALAALQQQASAMESLIRLQSEQKEVEAATNQNAGMTLEDFDRLVAQVEAECDPCPTCGALNRSKQHAARPGQNPDSVA